MRFPAGLRALNHRDFRIFTAGQLISLIGTWMQSVAQSWLVLELTPPFKLNLIGTLQFGPMLCFSFIAGAIADRLPKRRVIIGTQTALLVDRFGVAPAFGLNGLSFVAVIIALSAKIGDVHKIIKSAPRNRCARRRT